MELIKRKLRAMGYLATLPNYRLKHYGNLVVLEHYGPYGYVRGSYNMWKRIEKHTFIGVQPESLSTRDGSDLLLSGHSQKGQ